MRGVVPQQFSADQDLLRALQDHANHRVAEEEFWNEGLPKNAQAEALDGGDELQPFRMTEHKVSHSIEQWLHPRFMRHPPGWGNQMIRLGKDKIRSGATQRFTASILDGRSQWTMAMSTASNSLKTAQAYIGFVEAKDINGVAGVLSEKVAQMFLDCPEVSSREGVERITTDKVKPPPPIATFWGKKTVLNYTHGLMGKFSRIKWIDATWTAAGDHVYFAAKGDMIVEGSGKAYRNNYVMRFEFEGGRIVRIHEYGDAKAYSSLGLPIRPVEIRAFIRAFVHKLLGGS